jgi:hypothetical protein
VHAHCLRLANTALTGLNLPPGDSAIISLDLPDAAQRLAAPGCRFTCTTPMRMSRSS